VKNNSGQLMVALITVGYSVLLPLPSLAADSGEVRTHAEQSFDQLNQHREKQDSSKAPSELRHKVEDRNIYSGDHYLIGKGQGDLSKGKIVCQRVSELSARTDLAKQIRILVKEHMVDRVRERTGREAEQDIELTREEIVQEYLQGVKIVDHRIDEDNKTCSSNRMQLLTESSLPQQLFDKRSPPPGTTMPWRIRYESAR
jgi:hypothetical protein